VLWCVCVVDAHAHRKDELESAVETSSQIRFKKGEVLGAGSFGQVYLGLNEATGEYRGVCIHT